MIYAIMYDKKGNIKRKIKIDNFVILNLFFVKNWCSKIIFKELEEEEK
ncbi:MAG: hypothetical protein ACOC56_04195 [Atribacterota bacterium]